MCQCLSFLWIDPYFSPQSWEEEFNISLVASDEFVQLLCTKNTSWIFIFKISLETDLSVFLAWPSSQHLWWKLFCATCFDPYVGCISWANSSEDVSDTGVKQCACDPSCSSAYSSLKSSVFMTFINYEGNRAIFPFCFLIPEIEPRGA